jgi:hypothetical protein
MNSELDLRRKWTLRAHGQQVVFVKKAGERTAHVIMKALLWALYLPDYPDLVVEIRVGDRYKPDVVSLDAEGKPRFWAEAGVVGPEKIRSLARRYRATHFVIGKWDTRLDPFEALVREALDGLERSAPFDLIRFPGDSAEQFIKARGEIAITHDAVDWVRLS